MRQITFLLLLALLSTGTYAQQQRRSHKMQAPPHINKQEFRQHVQDFITREANLTEQEAKAFFPVFNEYKDKQRQIHQQIHALKNNKPKEGNDKAYYECIMKIAQRNAEVAGLDSVYYRKLCKVISAEKLHKILNIEDHMHRRMLQNYNRDHKQKRK